MDDAPMARVRINDFQVIRPLGTGGMGVVYLARQVTLNRLVALKVLGPTIDDVRARGRFRREAQAVALLKHPGIAEVYYAGQDDKACYMAVEYIDGPTLRQVINRLASIHDVASPLETMLQMGRDDGGEAKETRFDLGTDDLDSPDEGSDADPEEEDSITAEAERFAATQDFIRRCCEIISEAAIALEYAHTNGVTHRDIKPENLMLDRKGAVHLIDFGVARFRDDVSLSSTGALVGTPMYMSPEHITGRVNIDHRSDVYSLGIVLYELLTLQRPHAAPTREGVLREIVIKAMPPLSWKNAGVPRDLEAVVHKAIARDPEERYSSAGEFAQDLRNVIDDKPVAARPYRYRIDTREIAIERPIFIMIVGFTYLVMVMVCVFFIVGYAISPSKAFPGSAANRVVTYVMFFLFALVGGLAYFMGAGLLRGRRSAFVISSVIYAGILAVFARDLIKFPKTYLIFNFGSLLMYAGLLLCAGSLIMLNLPRTWRWIRYAESLRLQHKRRSNSR